MYLAASAIFVCVCVTLYAYLIHAPAAPSPTLSAAPVPASLLVGTRARSYIHYVPQGLRPHAPLLLILHGSNQDGARIRAWTGYAFDLLADREGFAVVYADGYKGNWNDFRRKGGTPAKDEDVDDVSFLRLLVAQMVKDFAIDPTRVFAMGYSNGGQMGFRLLAEAPELLAGLVVAGASLPVQESRVCDIGPTVPVMMVSGTADPIVPYHGGEVSLFGFSKRGRVLSAMSSAEELAQLVGAHAGPSNRLLPRRPGDATNVDVHTWQRDGQARVMLYTVHGGGHVVPQPSFRYPRLLGPTTSALDMPVEVVRFFGLENHK
jgi:polyhydroxybutyrate depolymerase